MGKAWKKKENVVLALLFAAYLIFNGILLAGHELWRDEANVWLIAGKLSPIQLFEEIRYQGHPCLWYLFVMPFAKIGLPFQTLSVLSYLIMAVTAGIFVYKAPFHPVTKFFCLISPIFSYYYPVVARNYCLIALILLLLAYEYPKRNERPYRYGILLGLLVQADTIALGTAGLISLMWLWEGIWNSIKRKKTAAFLTAVKGLWIPLVSLGLWIAEFYKVSDSPEFKVRDLSGWEFLHEIRNFSYHILTRMTGQGQNFDLMLILLFLVTGILISINIKSFWPFIVMTGTFLFETVFSVMVYQLHIWHYIMIGFALIWFFWTAESGRDADRWEKRGLAVLCRVLPEIILILLSVTMFMRWNSPEESSSLKNALYGTYSDGVNAADYIRQNVAEDELIFSTDVSECSTVLAYLGREYTLYYAGTQKQVTYADYTDEQKKTVTYGELTQWVKECFPEKKNFYILESPGNCIKDISDEIKSEFEVCYRTEAETARGESYTLYCVTLE